MLVLAWPRVQVALRYYATDVEPQGVVGLARQGFEVAAFEEAVGVEAPVLGGLLEEGVREKPRPHGLHAELVLEIPVQALL